MFQQKLILIRAERVLLQHCSNRRNISSKLTDAIRDKAKQALKRGSDAATEIYKSNKSKAIESARTAADEVKLKVHQRSSAVTQAASNAVKSSVHTVSLQVQSASTKAIESARTAADKVKGNVHQRSSAVTQAASNAVKSSVNTVSQQVQSASTKATDAVKDVSQQVQSASTKATVGVKDFSYQAVATTSEKIKQSSKAAASEASERLLGNVQEHARKAARWFWWWSLAAIGVYAIATTGTREIMRQVSDVLKGQSNSQGKLIEKNKDVESSNSPSGEEDRSWSTWISCISGLKKDCTETR